VQHILNFQCKAKQEAVWNAILFGGAIERFLLFLSAKLVNI